MFVNKRELNTENWLALHLAGFGLRRLQQITDVTALFDRGQAETVLRDMAVREKQHVRWMEYLAGKGVIGRQVEQSLHWQEQPRRKIITFQSELYPPLLLEINSPPLILYAVGESNCLQHRSISIVGARNPGVTGQKTARMFARQFAEHGLIVVSGLAQGIDAASHAGALQAGSTVAVLGTGIDRIYPRENESLAAQIAEQGILLSEFALGTAPLARNFPRRNRIISGMSLGVVVVEAAKNSGSLITARLALDANREVFAVPGSIHNPMSKGCHQLIREGATLVESVQDILQQLPISQQLKTVTADVDKRDSSSLTPDARCVLAAIGYEPTHIDRICQNSEMNVSLVNSLLIELELEGYVHSVAGGYIRT